MGARPSRQFVVHVRAVSRDLALAYLQDHGWKVREELPSLEEAQSRFRIRTRLNRDLTEDRRAIRAQPWCQGLYDDDVHTVIAQAGL